MIRRILYGISQLPEPVELSTNWSYALGNWVAPSLWSA